MAQQYDYASQVSSEYWSSLLDFRNLRRAVTSRYFAAQFAGVCSGTLQVTCHKEAPACMTQHLWFSPQGTLVLPAPSAVPGRTFLVMSELAWSPGCLTATRTECTSLLRGSAQT